MTAQQFRYWGLDIGIWVDRQRHEHIGPTLDQVSDRATDRFEIAPPTFTTMRRYEDQPAALELGFANSSIVQDRSVRFAQQLKRVDYRVSCDGAPFRREALLK